MSRRMVAGETLSTSSRSFTVAKGRSVNTSRITRWRSLSSMVIGDDHRDERMLTQFCHSLVIHGLTIIAHHCSILITERPQRNGAAAPPALRSQSGFLRGNSIKSANPDGRKLRMPGIGANSRLETDAFVCAALSSCHPG